MKKNQTDRLVGQKLVYMGDHANRKHHLGSRAGVIRRVTRSRAGNPTRIVIEDQTGLPAGPGRKAIKAGRVRLHPGEWTCSPRCAQGCRLHGIQRYGVIRSVDQVDELLRDKAADKAVQS